MNTTPTFGQHVPEPHDGLPAELVEIAARLDALGEQDRAADLALESRIFAASIPEFADIAEMHGRLEQLGQADRLAASVTMEEHVARASARELRAAPALHLVGLESADRRRTQHRRLVFTSARVRIAAAVLLVLTGGALTWTLSRPQGTKLQVATNAHTVPVAVLTQRVNDEMDTLFSVMGESSTTTADSASATASSASSTTTSSRVDWLDELVEEGRSS